MTVWSALVVGGGITGSMLSLALARRGVQVDLAEISPRWHGAGHGITVQGNALAALARLGVLDEVLKRGVPFDHVRMLRADGELIADVPTPRTGGPRLPATLGALRSDLQAVLCERVRDADVNVRLGLTVKTLSQDACKAHVEFTDGTTGSYDLVAGADGIRSAIRPLLGISTEPRTTGMSIWRVVAPRPAGMDCAERYDGGPRYMAGLSPVSASQCYAYIADEDRDDFGAGQPWQLMCERSAGYGGAWAEIRQAIGPDSCVSHTRIEWLLVPDPWYRGRVIVVGDAAHACPPLIAQGAAMCAEDAVVLAEVVTAGASLDRALPAFMARRLPRVRRVVRNSLQLARWETGAEPHTGQDVAQAVESTLGFLAASQA